IVSHHLWRREPPTLYGYGHPSRDYVHVYDVAEALLAAIGKPGIFNIATGTKVNVREVFQGLERAAGTSVAPVLAPLRPGELEHSCMDPSRARRELGWRPTIALADGLNSTYQALVEEFESERSDSA